METLIVKTRTRARRRITLAAALCVAGILGGGPLWPAVADTAPIAPAAQAQSAHQGVAVITVVRARDLMSAADRQAFRQALRQAGDDNARQRLRESLVARLQERAAEHGVVMVIQTHALRTTLHRNGSEPARPPRAP